MDTKADPSLHGPDAQENNKKETDTSATPASKPSLREKYALLAILKSFPVPSIVFSNNQSTVFLNPAFTEIFGYTEDGIPTITELNEKAGIRLGRGAVERADADIVDEAEHIPRCGELVRIADREADDIEGGEVKHRASPES